MLNVGTVVARLLLLLLNLRHQASLLILCLLLSQLRLSTPLVRMVVARLAVVAHLVAVCSVVGAVKPMFRWLMKLLCKPKLRIIFVIRNVSESIGVVKPTPNHYDWPLLGETIMGLQLTDSQFCTASIKPVDKKGNPANVDGAPLWSTDNTEVLALEPAADGLSCKVSAVGPLGSAKVSVKADALIGDGTVDLFGVLDVEVTAGAATSIEITTDAPAEQP